MPADAGEDGALAVLVGAEQDHRLVQIAAKYAGIIIVEGNDHTQVAELGAFPDGAVQVEYGVFPPEDRFSGFKTAEAIAGIDQVVIVVPGGAFQLEGFFRAVRRCKGDDGVPVGAPRKLEEKRC